MKTRPVISAAVDLGATSGRVIVGEWTGAALRLREVHRFPNAIRTLAGNDYWDVGTLWHEVQKGLLAAKSEFPRLASVGVDTWGVDYALVGKGGRLVQPVHAYRDLRTKRGFSALARKGHAEIFEETGNPNILYNSSLQLQEQLQAFPELKTLVKRCLFLPDYFHFLLSGKQVNEVSIASLSQLLSVKTSDWSPLALSHFGIPETWFQKPVKAGRRLGGVTIEALKGVEALLSPGHDTACAFTAMPAAPGGDDLYLSTGTWCLLGFESPTPMLGREALRAGISNERMGDGRFRPLFVGLGLWLLEKSFDEGVKKPGSPAEWAELVSAASKLPVSRVTLDLRDKAFFNPKSMTAAIAEACRKLGIKKPDTPAAYMRLVVDSIAEDQGRRVRLLSRLSGRTFRRILVVGGGSNNPLLCQALAERSGLPVHSLQLEGSAVGNIGTQLLGLGAVDSLAAFRSVIGRQSQARVHTPEGGTQ